MTNIAAQAQARQVVVRSGQASAVPADILTRHLERAYGLMWERYEAGEAPQMIDVPRIDA